MITGDNDSLIVLLIFKKVHEESKVQFCEFNDDL